MFHLFSPHSGGRGGGKRLPPLLAHDQVVDLDSVNREADIGGKSGYILQLQNVLRTSRSGVERDFEVLHHVGGSKVRCSETRYRDAINVEVEGGIWVNATLLPN